MKVNTEKTIQIYILYTQNGTFRAAPPAESSWMPTTQVNAIEQQNY